MFRITTNIFKNSPKIKLLLKQNLSKLSLPVIKNETFLEDILTHPSSPLNNNHHIYRRYCFYGDKAYNYYIARELYNKLPEASNTELTITTHQLISRTFLAEIAI